MPARRPLAGFTFLGVMKMKMNVQEIREWKRAEFDKLFEQGEYDKAHSIACVLVNAVSEELAGDQARLRKAEAKALS